ncbi:MAG: DUF447 domain-containing protein [Thiohalocapsa sp.]
MSEFIRETILITLGAKGQAHIAPMGVRERDDGILISPFRPSRTLDNLLREGHAVINLTDDVRVYAGCLTGHFDWPLVETEQIRGFRLGNCLAHQELVVTQVEVDEARPRVYCRVVHEVNHRPFRGFNRAQSATLEFAILISRLGMLPESKIDTELEYLRIAMDKTAGEREWEAWSWLEQRLLEHRRRRCA